MACPTTYSILSGKMPAYKKQHYLPAAYLKYFSKDQALCNRNSWIWRYDGKVTRRVPVESQCFRDYFYSKENAAKWEHEFQRREESYCRFVDELRAGKEPSRIGHGDLSQIWLICNSETPSIRT